MKTIKNFETFVNENKTNESWRQIKAWLRIPKILFELLLQKLIDFVPRLGTRYDILSAKIDTDDSLYKNVIKEELVKLKLEDIENDNLRKTLKITGLFNEWNIYTFDKEFSNKRIPIYISKDELQIGDLYYSERINDSNIDKRYGRGERKYLKSKGVKDISELEPQFYVVAAKKTEEHDEMEKERKLRSEKRAKRELEKLVDKCIKDDRVLSRSSQIYLQWNNLPILFKVVEADRLDLAKKLKDNVDEDDWSKMVNMKIDYEGWPGRGDKSPIDYAKSEEMKDFLRTE